MQNLCLFNTKTVSFDELRNENVVRRLVIDSERQRLYLLSSTRIYSFDRENHGLKSIYESNDKTLKLEDICWLSEFNQLCFGLSNGDLLNVQIDDEEISDANIIGTLEERIDQLILSPDQQSLVVVTKNKVLLLSTANDYEPIGESILDTDEFGEKEFVNVGWGSKTTQFHGSIGKKAALEPTYVAPIKTQSENDDGRSRVVWREDGDLFAVSFVSSSKNCRIIKIFNKQGQLQATSESNLNGFIESTIAWKTSGELLTAPMRFNNGQKMTISFLEKNGLKHGEFLLESSAFVEHLAWNKDSTILALVISQKNQTELQLWSSSNYHWYLKQSFPFGSVRIQAMQWDLDTANRLEFVTDHGQYYSMCWSWTTDVSYTNVRSLVHLIDGFRLHVTDFTHSSVPPPMSSYEIHCPTTIVSVSTDDEHEQLVLVLSDRSICICDSSSNSSEHPTVVHLNGLKSIYYIRTIISSSESPIKNIVNSSHYRLLLGKLYFVEDGQLHIYDLDKKSKQSTRMPFSCFTTTVCLGDKKIIYFQDHQGKVFRFENNQFENQVDFPRPCSQFSALSNGDCLGLTENYRLYLNSNELVHNCNSYFIHDQTILVYSTLQHQLAFRSLVNGQTVTETSHRRTERGTRIVCTGYADLKLVLQMPRGNLETIYPRPLLLTFICSELIDHRPENYRRAFDLMRKNRLNFNFLYDYNPKEFSNQIEKFIDEARNDDDLCLFLSELDNEKNTRDEYMKFILKCERTGAQNDENYFPKANLICQKFRSVLLSRSDRENHMNSILTSFIKESPSNIEGALKYLSENRSQFDNAVRYLIYFIDIDRLYDIALGTYDFDLVLMVSEKTQKDPKEYLPELNRLRSIENVHWQKFQIDLRLKRWRKAVENGCDYFLEQLINKTTNENDERFPIFVNIVETQRLYKLAIKRFLSNENLRPSMFFVREILRLFGDYLMTKKYYVDAGLVYERAHLIEQAIRAFRQGKDVQNVLKLLPSVKETTVIHGSSSEYRLLAEQCRNDGLYAESGQIYEFYLNDCEEALVSYVQGHHWSHGFRLLSSSLSNRSDLYEHEFVSSIKDFHDDLLRQIEKDFEKFEQDVERLKTIRKNLFEHIKSILDAGRDYDFDENDDQSEHEDRETVGGRTLADETGSIRTRLTKKSSSASSSKKSQRRAAAQQEKLVQLKQGSKHEDVALVRELSLLISKFDKLNGEVRHLCKIFYQITTKENRLEFEEKGERLQKKYDECLTTIEKSLPTIWLSNVEQKENVQSMIILKKIREKFLKDLDLISNSYRVAPILLSKSSQWKFVLFDKEPSI